ncbi:methyl-accepting chemotaxis protein [Candidatus Nitrospira salsa]
MKTLYGETSQSQRNRGGEGAMKQMMQTFLSWGIAAKLVTLFLVFGVVPMSAVGLIAYNAGEDMKAGVGLRFATAAEDLANKIDRNLAERYGDVQAFGYNDAVHRISQWYDPTPYNTVSQVMNKYAQAYGIYDLLIMVDTRGDVIAVNNTDSAGNPINSQFIFEQNYSQSPWFKALSMGEYTTKQPFTAPGNDTVTGTFIEDTHLDSDVAKATGKDGYVMGFSAPVYGQNGEVVAYWSNRTSMRGVEKMFQDTYRALKSQGFPGSEVTLLDSRGRVLVDYDPGTHSSEEVVRNFDELMKANLVEKGVMAAQEAIAGKTGNVTEIHARKQINQVAGYTHLKGAMGFPGMNWAIIVRVPEEEALSDANSVQSSVMQTGLICLAVIAPIGWFVGRKGAQQVVRVQAAAEKMASGEYDARVDVKSRDEIGQLGDAFNQMASEIQGNITKQQQAANEMSRIKTALDNASTNVLVCDRNYEVIYQNHASAKTLKKHESDIQKGIPGFDASKMVGSNIDQYHKNPSHQRRLLDDPRNLPHRVEIQVGPLMLDLNAAAIMSADGEYLGNVLEWADITAQKKAEKEVDQLIGAAAAGDLSNRIDAEQFEGFFKSLSTGVNRLLDAIVSPLKEATEVLQSLSEGHLSKTMDGNYEGEFNKIKQNLNTAIKNLTGIVSAVREGADSVSTASQQITSGNEDLSQRTSQQASALEETSASMEEMTSTIKQNADNAKQANQLAVAAREVAEKGGSVTERAVEAMSEINKSSKKIADIINVIDEIAFQTNLLALNAAVEAARAGEQGRGFAVVASEVRNLAGRSATAAKEIKTLINESVQKVGDGSDLVNQSGQTLEEIVNSVKRVTDIISEISAASQEQAAGIDQVNKAVIQMDQTTQQNAALVEETTSASQSMRQQAGELLTQVAFFKTDDSGAGDSKVGLGNLQSTRVASTRATSKSSGGQQKNSVQTAKSVSGSSKSKSSPEPETAGVGSGNGHDRRQRDDDFFEEF